MKKVLPLIVFVLMTFMSSAQSILKEGYKLIPCEYSKMTPFRNGKSQVVKNGRTYTINTKGEIIR